MVNWHTLPLINFGNPEKIKYGCFFCVPDGKMYAIKAYFCPINEAPESVWDALDKVVVTYGYLVPTPGGWTWKNADGQRLLGPDPEILSRKKTIGDNEIFYVSCIFLNRMI